MNSLDQGLPLTPLEELKCLSRFLGGPRLFIKRDDRLPFGGSKFRKASALVEEAVRHGATAMLTEGSIESQHARALAIACRNKSIRCVLVLSPETSEEDPPTLLNETEGAEILLVETVEERPSFVKIVHDELCAQGERVEVIPFSGSTPVTAVAYFWAFEETMRQADEAGVTVDSIFVSSATGGIQAGLELGKRLLYDYPTSIVGVSPGLSISELRNRIRGLVCAGGELLNRNVLVRPEEILILDQYIGDGYLNTTPESRSAQQLLHRLEGLKLDPIYTAKTMSALIDQIRKGALGVGQTVIFWHSAS